VKEERSLIAASRIFLKLGIIITIKPVLLLYMFVSHNR
jgi:hypothetical protein